MHNNIENSEAATKYISDKYDKSYRPMVSESRIFGLRNITSQKPNIVQTPYIISGEGKSKSEAWDEFWQDFDQKTQHDGKRNIYWRHPVEVVNDRDFEEIQTNYKIQCRFSLVE